MSNYLHIVPFIKFAEGGLSKNPADSASSDPVPDGSGYHTNKGITWTVWSSFFGSNSNSIERFYAMCDEDFGTIFKKNYWDQVLGDQINSQRISDFCADWVYNCGKHYPEIEIQEILVAAFGDHIGEDGNFGPATIQAINAADELTLWNDIISKRISYYQNLAATHPNDEEFLNGWENRVKNIQTFEETGQLV